MKLVNARIACTIFMFFTTGVNAEESDWLCSTAIRRDCYPMLCYNSAVVKVHRPRHRGAVFPGTETHMPDIARVTNRLRSWTGIHLARSV